MSANKVLFIVNPISGIQNNRSIAELITDTLKNYQIKYNLIYTPRAGYAKEYIYSMNAALYKKNKCKYCFKWIDTKKIISLILSLIFC